MNTEEQEVPQEDILDAAILDIVDELVGDEASEDDVDDCVEEVFQLLEQLEEQELIDPVPDNGVSEDVLKAWLDKNLPVLKQAIKEGLEQSGEEQEI